jgi:ribosome-binding protein aMBF1 (putative translation factor)
MIPDMLECFRCGISGENTMLHSAISNKGVVKLCSNCLKIEHLPVIRKPTEEQLAEAQKPRTIKSLINSRGITQKEPSLRSLIDQKFSKQKIQQPTGLKNNFHWLIQGLRRERKITRGQLAKEIGENEATIRIIENGSLLEGNYKIIAKIENFFKVSLRKTGSSGFPDVMTAQKKFILDNSLIEKEQKELASLKFDKERAKTLKISDLRNMKKRQEQEKAKNTNSQVEGWEDEYPMDDERFLDSKGTEGFYEEADFR